MNFTLTRVLRTPHSERFLLRQGSVDAAALDLHYLAGAGVSGTFVVFERGPIKEEDVPELLGWLDENLLPDVSISDGNLSFTVVFGRGLGSFVPNASEDIAEPASAGVRRG